jgi:putative thioredoxin
MQPTPYAFDAHQSDFDETVIRRSHEVPVLVDFWAAWCGPCKTLMPLLARLADQYGGKFLLAKVDTDAEQTLAARHQIRSIPTVILYRNGKPIDQFMGAQPESAVRALLDRHIPRASDAAVVQARAALEAGRAAEALALLDAACATDPGNARIPPEQVRALAELGRFDEADTRLKSLPAALRDDPELLALRARIDLGRAAAAGRTPAELEAALLARPDDHDARYQLALQQISRGRHEDGLAQLLEIVKRDRHFRDDAARKAMLQTFSVLGMGNELVKRYRTLLANALN